MSLLNRLRYHLRARVYDASRKVEWIDHTMYDQEDMVDNYDTANLAPDAKRWRYELQFLDMIETLNIRSVLDLGCGAGAFYYLLSKVRPDVTYFGYDLSQAQIRRACDRFCNHFEARDIADVSREEVARFDAVLSNSVLTFMSPDSQIAIIRRIVQSGAKLFVETGVTMPDINYVPRSAFRHYGQHGPDGRELMTAVSFPYKSELERAVRGSRHNVICEEHPYANTRAINASERSGAALADKKALKAKRPRLEKFVPFSNKATLIMATVKPKDWTPRSYTPSEIETRNAAIFE